MGSGSLLPVLAAAFGSTVGGMGAVAARLLAEEAGPAAVSMIRYLGLVALLLLGMAMLRLRLQPIRRRDLPALIAVGVLQFWMFGWLLSAGFEYVGAARGAIMLSTMPIQTMLIAAAIGREHVTARKALGMGLGVVGVAVALWSDAGIATPDAWKGDLMLCAAAFVTALNSVMIGPYLVRYSVLTVSLVATIVGAGLLGLTALGSGELGDIARLSPRGWAALAFFAAGPTFMGFITWTWALSRVAATRVTVTVVLNPISAAIAGALYLGEPVDPRILVGLALVSAAILLVNWPTASGSRR
jgi:drug/metabolite transporter (DMT)-like permease